MTDIIKTNLMKYVIKYKMDRTRMMLSGGLRNKDP
jgi:hypothetical protein